MSALRAIPAALLTGVSAVLSGAAKMAELGARRLSPPSPASRESFVVDTTPSPLTAVDDAETPGEVLDLTTDEILEDLGTGGDVMEETVEVAAERVGVVIEVAPDRAEDATGTAEETVGATPGEAEPEVTADLPPGDDGHERTYESHIAELAEHPVARVVKEIQDLSTEELGQLFEYESAHRKRKTVLQAIERASAPE